jgi:hypothetical protein
MAGAASADLPGRSKDVVRTSPSRVQNVLGAKVWRGEATRRAGRPKGTSQSSPGMSCEEVRPAHAPEGHLSMRRRRRRPSFATIFARSFASNRALLEESFLPHNARPQRAASRKGPPSARAHPRSCKVGRSTSAARAQESKSLLRSRRHSEGRHELLRPEHMRAAQRCGPRRCRENLFCNADGLTQKQPDFALARDRDMSTFCCMKRHVLTVAIRLASCFLLPLAALSYG